MILRLFHGDDGHARAQHIAGLLRWIASHENLAENVVPTAEGCDCLLQPSGSTLVAFEFCDGSPLALTSMADYRRWGHHVGRLHRLMREYPMKPYGTLHLTSDSVRALVSEGQRILKRYLPSEARLRRELDIQSERACACLAETAPQVVHGDLWPGNVLEHDGALRAIDFSESMLAPFECDLATALRWMPSDATRQGARQEYLTGYRDECPRVTVDMAWVAAFAVVQQVRFMVEEVAEAELGRDESGASAIEYVEDHRGRIGQLVVAEIDRDV